VAELDTRKQTILRAVIVEYVDTAEPIGSEMLSRKYEFGVKSATVRNELAELTELGFLEQPHTSAGRIPSDLGYRYYVDRLIVHRELEDASRNRMKEAVGEGDALRALLADTVKALSRVTRLLGVATTIRDTQLVVRNAVVSALGPKQALVVLVLNNGHIENRMIEVPVGLSLDDIGLANDRLATSVVGKSLGTLSRAKNPGSGGNAAIDKLLGSIWAHIRTMAREMTRGTIITEGEEFMFGQPEFQRNLGLLSAILNDLTESDVLYEAVANAQDPQTVTIGREHQHETMRNMSVVRQTFFVGENEAGVVGIVGPTRMLYDRGIPLVDYTARALSQSLTRLWG
jgi:heat-inducible transcriptional repressor